MTEISPDNPNAVVRQCKVIWQVIALGHHRGCATSGDLSDTFAESALEIGQHFDKIDVNVLPSLYSQMFNHAIYMDNDHQLCIYCMHMYS